MLNFVVLQEATVFTEQAEDEDLGQRMYHALNAALQGHCKKVCCNAYSDSL